MATKKLQILDSITKQADWNQTDETQKDYIKNKPNEAEALELVVRMGLTSPAIANDGSLYTDKNGMVYTL